nr:uncharacterized protein LOC129453662 [Misgurnus anguillicaudatus]
MIFIESVMEKLIHLILVCGLASSQDNLALKGTVNQASIYSPFGPDSAKDGVIRYEGAYCSITKYETNPWWRVDLWASYAVMTVVITNRGDCCEDQTNGAEIRIGDSLENNGNNNSICAVVSGLSVGVSFSYSCNGMMGRYVNVVMTGRKSHLTVCEVEVYGTENFALRGNASQSSVLYNWTPIKAKDGIRSGQDPFTHCSHTENETNPWWRLDLLDIYNISTVVIASRRRCCEDQINGVEIRIGNSPEDDGNNNSLCAVTTRFAKAAAVSYSCTGMSGRYVNVVMPALQYLTVCEVEVYGTVNFARQGQATQSSIYAPWVAQTAIDGKNFDSTCSITGVQMSPWWSVDLLDSYAVSTVSITNRGDCCPDQTNDAEIRVGNSPENNGNDNPICAVISDLPLRTTANYSCNQMVGRYVNVVKTGKWSHLSLCEVEVYGKAESRRIFLRLKFVSSVNVAAMSNKILSKLHSFLSIHISNFTLSWTRRPHKGMV